MSESGQNENPRRSGLCQLPLAADMAPHEMPSADHLSHSAKLIDPLSRKSISTMPKHANRTPFALVIDSLLVRATDYAVGHCNRQHLMFIDKFQYLTGDAGLRANVTLIHFPVAQLCHLCILGWHNANSDLSRLAQVRTVERNCGKWPTPQSPSSFLS